MNSVHIISTGSYLPGEALTNSDLEKLVGSLSPEILAQVQVEKRYWLIDPVTGEHRMTNSAMATNAARQALEHTIHLEALSALLTHWRRPSSVVTAKLSDGQQLTKSYLMVKE